MKTLLKKVLKRSPGRPKDPDLEQRRRHDILTTAATVFANRGFAEADVQEIADRLKIGKGTVYRYYPTKQELFLATVDRGLTELSTTVDAIIEDTTLDPIVMIRRAVTEYLRYFAEHPEMAELFVQERAAFRDRHTPLYFAEKYAKHDRDVPFIQALIKHGVFRKVNPRATLDVLCDLLYGTVLSNHLASRKADPASQADAILDVIFNGLLSETQRQKAKPTMKRKLPVLVALLTLGLVGCGGASSSAGSAAKEAKAIVVTVEPIAKKSLPRSVSAVGTLNGFEEVTLAPKVEGRILNIRADIGDRVAPGTVLLELDPRDYELSILEAKQALNSELAKLNLTALPVGEFDVAKVPAVIRAAASLEDAMRRWKIKKELVARNAASTDESDILETEYKVAEATRNQMATEAQATLAAARLRKASLDLAEQRRLDCTLTVPVPSKWTLETVPPMTKLRYAVASRMVSEGEMVRSMPVTNAFKLVLDFNLKLKVAVPEKHIPDVSVGQPVEVLSDAFPGRVFMGKVTRVNPTVDTLNRTFAVEIEVPNLDGALKCGGFAKASIRTKAEAMALTVPPSAIVSFAGVNKIFVMDGDKAKAVDVVVGTRDKDWVEVSGTMSPDVKVITSGLTQVTDGAAVKIRE